MLRITLPAMPCLKHLSASKLPYVSPYTWWEWWHCLCWCVGAAPQGVQLLCMAALRMSRVLSGSVCNLIRGVFQSARGPSYDSATQTVAVLYMFVLMPCVLCMLLCTLCSVHAGEDTSLQPPPSFDGQESVATESDGDQTQAEADHAQQTEHGTLGGSIREVDAPRHPQNKGVAPASPTYLGVTYLSELGRFQAQLFIPDHPVRSRLRAILFTSTMPPTFRYLPHYSALQLPFALVDCMLWGL